MGGGGIDRCVVTELRKGEEEEDAGMRNVSQCMLV